MKVLWCWRCKKNVAMLDEEEYKYLTQLWWKARKFKREINEPIFDENRKVLGYRKATSDEKAILIQLSEEINNEFERITGDKSNIQIAPKGCQTHHLISRYGPSCEKCGKILRTSKARKCFECGHVKDKSYEATSFK
jgi:hypothetical protein